MAIPGLIVHKKSLNIKLIESCVLSYFDSDSENIKKCLKSKSRRQPIVYYRHLILFFCYKYTRFLSLEEIGSYYGRDHATVTHSKNKIVKLCSVYKETYKEVIEIDKTIRSYEKPVLNEKEEEEKIKEDIKKYAKEKVLSFTERVSTGYKINKNKIKKGKILKGKEARYKKGRKKNK